MKVKRFKNLWAMGLLLFGAILIAFYIAKIFFPQFIIGVAELPSIVKFGNYVDNHKWAYYLYHFTIGVISGYLYCCACCRQRKLTYFQLSILIGFIILSLIIQHYLTSIYSPFNYVMIIIMPFVMMTTNKNINEKTFISLVMCFSIDIMTQALSLVVRNVIVLTICVNSATMFVLLIDTLIWRTLLYLYFNYKQGE